MNTDVEQQDTRRAVDSEPNRPGTSLWLRFAEFVRQPLEQVNRESREFQQKTAGRRDAKSAIVLMTVAVALTVQEYAFGSGAGVSDIAALLRACGSVEFGNRFAAMVTAKQNRELAELSYWIFGQLVGYVLIPLIAIKWILRERVRDFGVVSPHPFAGKTYYLAMYLLMLPGLYLFSHTAGFQSSYPFYKLLPGEELGPRFFIWEVLYALQFVGLEFFFRGFILHGTKHRFGAMSIFVMMVPYCMLHFGKPMPETFGAIVAGIVLGFACLKSQSIWLGAAIHIAVAWSMDTLVLLNRV